MRGVVIGLASLLAGACVPPAPSVDASVDAAVPTPDGGVPLDAEVLDAELRDAEPRDALADASDDAMDAGPVCLCEEPPPECTVAACDGERCVFLPAEDGTVCGDGRLCVGGACSVGVCGDGYRERGPDPAREGCDDGNLDVGDACSPSCTPDVLLVASRSSGADVPSRAALAQDARGVLLFAWAAEVGEDIEVRARRFRATGVAIDETPFVLDAGLGVGWDPQAVVAGLDEGWVIAWSAPEGEGDIRYRTVRADRSLGAIRVANQERRGRQGDPAIARIGGSFAIAWTDESGLVTGLTRSRVVHRRFDLSSGLPLMAEESLNAAGRSSRAPSIAVAGDHILVAWTEEPDDPFALSRVMARRLGGASPDASAFELAADGSEVALAALGTGAFAAAWVERGADPLGDIATRTVAATGDPLGAVARVSAAPGRAELAPSVGATRMAEYAVAFEDGGRRRGLVVAQVGSGTLAAEASVLAGHLTSGLQGDASLLATTKGLWVAWSDAGLLGAPDSYRSFLAFLLPVD